MKLSIVITHHNRKAQLINTLRSMQPYIDIGTEIIIVDDKSNERITDITGMFPFNIKLIERTERGEYDLAAAHNIGFSAVTGDVILINNAECMHYGDIIGDIKRYFGQGHYFAYSTYSIDWSIYHSLRFSYGHFNIDEVVMPTHPLPEKWNDMDTGWYSHPEHKWSLMPFCAAIASSDMDILRGYDERFDNAVGWIDHDFVHRIKNLGLICTLRAEPFCIHQPHTPTDYSGRLNNELFVGLQVSEPLRLSCDWNKNYKR
jgi:glycosyltransferase involved in cell wall biosynthesis